MSPPDYFKEYLDMAEEHGFKPTSAREIIRYLMVNGHIPVTEAHLTLMGDTDFYISADKVPEYVKAAEAHYLKHPYDGEYYEEVELETLKTHGNKVPEHHHHVIEGMHFKGGEMVDFKVSVTRVIKVETSYYYHEPAWGDPDYHECFKDMPHDERVQQDWDKANICPHCEHVAEPTEGYSEMYEDDSCLVRLGCCGKAFYVIRPEEPNDCLLETGGSCETCPQDHTICLECMARLGCGKKKAHLKHCPDFQEGYTCEDCGERVSEYYQKQDDDTVLCQNCFERTVTPWTNRICSECKPEYYANCPFNGIPQPHCDEPRMKKDT